MANSIDSTIMVVAQEIAATGWALDAHDVFMLSDASKGVYGNWKKASAPIFSTAVTNEMKGKFSL